VYLPLCFKGLKYPVIADCVNEVSKAEFTYIFLIHPAHEVESQSIKFSRSEAITLALQFVLCNNAFRVCIAWIS
jgi:hypothetical protein